MVDFLTKPFQKMPKKQSRKGGSVHPEVAWHQNNMCMFAHP